MRWSDYTKFPLLIGMGALGCETSELPGHYWDVEIVSTTDECNNPPIGSQESYEYRLFFDSTKIELSIGPDLLATGFISGCEVQYTSAIWATEREDFEIRWQLTGTATVDRGDGCAAGADEWVGVEAIEVISTTDPELTPGCRYHSDVIGTYLYEVE